MANENVPGWLPDKKDWHYLWKHPWKVSPSRLKHPRFKRKLRRRGVLSPNFSMAGAYSKPDGCGCPQGKPLKYAGRVQKLAFMLEDVRHGIGDKAIGALSVERSDCHNSCIKGARLSQHVEGRAIDPLNLEGVPWPVWNREFSRVFSKGGIGRGCNSGNVQHVDYGPQRNWCYAGR